MDLNFLIIVTGGISIYKVCGLVSYLSREHTVKVMMSESAMKFINPLLFQVLSKQEVVCDLFDEDNGGCINHIYYSQEYDCVIVAPATMSIVGKVANGISDDLCSTTILASNKPVIFVPSMNTVMYNNPVFKVNISKLKKYGYKVMDADKGTLACGCDGDGRYPDNRKIVEFIKEVLM